MACYPFDTVRFVDAVSHEEGEQLADEEDRPMLWVTLKGFPTGTGRTQPSTQAEHWFKDALFDMIEWHGEDAQASLALALPGFPRHRRLAEGVRWLQWVARFSYLWEHEDGSVSAEHHHHGPGDRTSATQQPGQRPTGGRRFTQAQEGIVIQVHLHLFVGDENDYWSEVSGRSGWAVVHACKEPFHREALGYTSRGAPRDHPEYLVARRGDRLILNIIDVDNPAFFSEHMIRQALDFIDEQLALGMNVLVHCNQGESRGPSIALLYLAARLGAIPKDSLEVAEERFRQLYPRYNPKTGLREHLLLHWQEYCSCRQGNPG